MRGLNCVLIVALLGVPASASAQLRVEFTPLVGSYDPTGFLVTVDNSVGAHAISAVREHAGLTYGGRATAWLSDRVGLEASYVRSASGTEDWVKYAGVAMLLAYFPQNASGHVSLMSARLLYMVTGDASSASVYLLAGPADVEHRGSVPQSPPVPLTASDLGAVVGIGLRVTTLQSAVAVRLGAEDYYYGASFSEAGWSSSHVQNDLLLSLELSVHLGNGSSR